MAFTYEKRKVSQPFFQNLNHPPIRFVCVSEQQLEDPKLWKPFEDLPHRIGIHGAYISARSGKLKALAISTNKTCIVIIQNGSALNLERLKTILTRDSGLIIGFNLNRLAMSLYRDLDLRITNGVDVQSVYADLDPPPIHPLDLIKAGIDNEYILIKDNIISNFNDDLYDEKRVQDLVRKAWVAQFLATIPGKEERFEGATKKINTRDMSLGNLTFLSAQSSEMNRLEMLKPTSQTHEIITVHGEMGTAMKSTRFQNRVRETAPHQRVEIEVAGGFHYFGSTTTVTGRKAHAAPTSGSLEGKQMTRATTTGRDGPTRAEQAQGFILASALTDPKVLAIPWVQNIWFTTQVSDMKWPEDWQPKSRSPSPPSANKSTKKTDHLAILNPSQLTAVQHMMSSSPDDYLCIVHGPPGTGKTSVIARYVMTVVDLEPEKPGIWLVAQSNVAVKNIAEKLHSLGFKPWRLLVSKDFHMDWHEHLYQIPRHHVIRSDQFNEALKKLTGDNCKVILCTLSMLSNAKIKKFTAIVPLNRLVVDEASQITLGAYLPAFKDFTATLRKVCFIGDPRQLPPHGQEEIEDIKSIFEVDHLGGQSLLLDTQYRMPPQIGQFISEAVYDKQLFSNPKHSVVDTTLACQFIDVNGNELLKGTSSMNVEEVQAVLLLAKHFQDQKLSYRIITGYDAQRTEIELAMRETEGLNSDDKCFNVDSFQGNEDDYIIISLVKTKTLGFLNNQRRTNVMLSRCKKGMFILGNRRFFKGGSGSKCLVGQLIQYMEGRVGEKAWIEASALEEETFEVGRSVPLL